MLRKKWIGVDFDETLRRYDDTPIQPMVDRVRRWLAEGKYDVRIVTARLYRPKPEEFQTHDAWCEAVTANLKWCDENGGMDQAHFIQDWCEKHVGTRLPVQWGKSPGMIELWDDKVVRVVANQGRRISPCAVEGPMSEADHYHEVIEAARRVKRGCDCEYDHRCGRCDDVVSLQQAIDAMDESYRLAEQERKFFETLPEAPLIAQGTLSQHHQSLGSLRFCDICFAWRP